METEGWCPDLLSPVLGYVIGVWSDFSRDWESNDLRVSIFKLLLAWLVLSVTAIHLAWRSYGHIVNELYYRQGMGGQNGGTPEYPSHYPMWESGSTESLKTHQE